MPQVVERVSHQLPSCLCAWARISRSSTERWAQSALPAALDGHIQAADDEPAAIPASSSATLHASALSETKPSAVAADGELGEIKAGCHEPALFVPPGACQVGALFSGQRERHALQFAALAELLSVFENRECTAFVVAQPLKASLSQVGEDHPVGLTAFGYIAHRLFGVLDGLRDLVEFIGDARRARRGKGSLEPGGPRALPRPARAHWCRRVSPRDNCRASDAAAPPVRRPSQRVIALALLEPSARFRNDLESSADLARSLVPKGEDVPHHPLAPERRVRPAASHAAENSPPRVPSSRRPVDIADQQLDRAAELVDHACVALRLGFEAPQELPQAIDLRFILAMPRVERQRERVLNSDHRVAVDDRPPEARSSSAKSSDGSRGERRAPRRSRRPTASLAPSRARRIMQLTASSTIAVGVQPSTSSLQAFLGLRRRDAQISFTEELAHQMMEAHPAARVVERNQEQIAQAQPRQLVGGLTVLERATRLMRSNIEILNTNVRVRSSSCDKRTSPR